MYKLFVNPAPSSIPRFDAPCVFCLKICKVIIGHQRAEDCVYSALYNPSPLRAQLWNCLIRMIKTILSPLLTGFILKCSPHSRFLCFKIVAPDSWHILCVLTRQTRHLQNNKYETKLPYNWTQTKTYRIYTRKFLLQYMIPFSYSIAIKNSEQMVQDINTWNSTCHNI